jgi:hypothetical protein
MTFGFACARVQLQADLQGVQARDAAHFILMGGAPIASRLPIYRIL